MHEPRLQVSGIWLCYLHQIMIIKHKFKYKITKSFKIKTTEFEIPSAEIEVWGPGPQEASGAHTRDWRTAASQIFLNEAVCHGGKVAGFQALPLPNSEPLFLHCQMCPS